MQSKASAVWEGDLFTGSGRTSLDSGVATDMPVTWASRTEQPGGKTSPEELIAAAHAACFSMALSNGLAKEGHPPARLATEAVATFDRTDAGFRLILMELSVVGDVPGIGEEEFVAAAAGAKEGCPVSNALKGNVEIAVTARLG